MINRSSTRKINYFRSIKSKIMVKVGLLSDTHGFWDDKYALYFNECDEIWHAGDIGSAELAER